MNTEKCQWIRRISIKQRDGVGGESYSQIMEKKIASMLSEAKRLCEEGKPESAVVKMTRAIALQPNNPDLFKIRAEANVSLSNYHAAIINFKKVIRLRKDEEATINKRLAVVYYNYGMTLLAEKNYAEAVDFLEFAAYYDPGNKEVVFKRMECLMALERYNECLDVVEKELQEDDSNSDLYVIRAELNLLFGNTSKSYFDVRKALELDEHHHRALEIKKDLEKRAKECKNQAIHQSLLGKRNIALKKINEAIETDPSVSEYHILRGSLYRRMGDFKSAVDDYLLSMDKCGHQQDSDVYINASKQLILTYNDFAMECFKQRHFDSAVTLLNKAIKQVKDEKGLYLNRGDCFYRMNKLRFALSDYQQALELDPNNWGVYCRIGVVCSEIGVELFRRGEYSEAEKFFSSAIQYNPKVSWFYVCRARARYELKDTKGTKEDILSSLALDPSSDESLSLIARVYPGKSKDELICSRQSAQIQSKLEAVIAKMSSIFQAGSQRTRTDNDYISGKTAFYLWNLDLKVADTEEGVLGDIPTAVPPASSKVTPEGDENRKLSEHQTLSQSACTGASIGDRTQGDGSIKVEERFLAPREWSVLSYPLPELSTDPHGVLPALKDYMEEHNFHRCIYYTKKNCTDELEHVLRSHPEKYIMSRRPKLTRRRTRDLVVLGSRTINQQHY